MSQFSNYFENNWFVEPTVTNDYPDISNVWPVKSIQPVDTQKVAIVRATVSKVQKHLSQIEEVLEKQDYLTEGEVLENLGMKSTVSNPFRFYEGNSDIYREQLSKKLEERKQTINRYRREVRLIEEALGELK